MSRGQQPSAGPLVVRSGWSRTAASPAHVVRGRRCRRRHWRSAAAGHGSFDDLLVGRAPRPRWSSCAGWLWVVTTATVADVADAAGRRARRRAASRRRLRARSPAASAVVAGVGSPGARRPGRAGLGEPRCAGLPLPDRAVATARTEPAPVAAADRPSAYATAPADPATVVVVRPATRCGRSPRPPRPGADVADDRRRLARDLRAPTAPRSAPTPT